MKKSLQIFAAAFLLAGLSSDLLAQNTYRWRAQAGGNWSNPSNWAVFSPDNAPMSGPNTSLPTANDNVIFDGSSFDANGRTVTVDVDASAQNLDWSAITRTVTFTVNQPLTVSGNLILSSLIQRRTGGPNNNPTIESSIGAGANGRLVLTSTAVSAIRSNTVRMDLPVVFNGTGGRWILQDDMTVGISAQFVSGHVVALPLAITSPLDPDGAFPPTETSIHVGEPRLRFTTTSALLSASVSGASHASHVIGYVQKLQVNKEKMPDGTNFTFPVGDGTYYRPITMQDPSMATGDFTARYISANPFLSSWRTLVINSPLNSVSDREFWYFTASGSANTRFSFNYNHPDPAVAAFYRLDRWTGISIAGLSVSTSQNAAWSDIGGTPTSLSTTATIPSAAGTSSSNAWFTIARRGNTPLPVRLVSFTARRQGEKVQLGWQSSSEENTSHFQVERSADGINFSTLTTVAAQGNSSSLTSYQAADESPLAGTCYYRLRMADLDGSFAFSKTVSVTAGAAGLQVKACPNPSQGTSVLLSESSGAKLRLLALTDMSGRRVACQTTDAGADGLGVNFTSTLPPGIYLATLSATDDARLLRVKFSVR